MFTGLYFDGKSSKGYQCQIEFAPSGIDLRYVVTIPFSEDQTEERAITWSLDKIHQGHYTRTEKVTLKYGDFPNQYLEVDNPEFFGALQDYYPQKKFNASDFEFLRKITPGGMIAVALGFAALVALSYFFVLPPLAEFAAGHMPIKMEEELGDRVYEQMMESASINQAQTKEANEFWRALHVQSPYLINITVIHEKIPNAFALPGGQIIVYDGIIKEMKDYDEFAALLAHEYTHAYLRHSVRSLSRNLAGYIFVSLLLNDASGTIAVLATNGNKLKELSFSRELEHQTDAGGYKLLQSKNINPNGMLKLFATLKGVEGNMTIPRFISTHPLTSERMDYIEGELKKDKTQYTDEHADLKAIWAQMKADE